MVASENAGVGFRWRCALRSPRGIYLEEVITKIEVIKQIIQIGYISTIIILTDLGMIQ